MKPLALAIFGAVGIGLLSSVVGLADTKQEAAKATPTAVQQAYNNYDSGIGLGIVTVSTDLNDVDIQRLDGTSVRLTVVPGEGLNADLGIMHKRQVTNEKQVLTPGVPVVVKVPMDLATMRVTVGTGGSTFSDQKGHKLSITIGGYNTAPYGGMF